MSHHGSHDGKTSGILKELYRKLNEECGAGPTGRFPRGRLNEHDEGELVMAVGVKDNTVILAFGKPVSWIGFSRVEAVELAELLKTRAAEL